MSTHAQKGPQDTRPAGLFMGLKTQMGNFFTLRPYGGDMAGPAVEFWIRSVGLVIFLMATVEATVWAMIGGFLAPGEGWTDALVSACVAIGMFILIWTVDRSFVMAEQPLFRHRGPDAHRFDGDSHWRRGLGTGIRVGIVAISLWVTAPLLTLVLNQDRIGQLYQEKKLADEAKLSDEAKAKRQRDMDAKTAAVDSELLPLQAQVADLERRGKELSLAVGDPEGAYKGALEQQRADIAQRKQDLDDEISGKRGKPNCGPACRVIQEDLRRKEQELAATQARAREEAGRQAERSNLELAEVTRQIAELRPKMDELGTEKRKLLAEFHAEEDRSGTGGKIESKFVLSLATQWELLEEILAKEKQERSLFRHGGLAASAEPGWLEKLSDHLRSVDGLAQAVLSMLFLSMLALKIFEPKSARLYFSEECQLKWEEYKRGAFDHIPGFPPGSDPARRLNHIDFARTYIAYAEDPAAFIEEHVARLRQEAAATGTIAEEDLARRLKEAEAEHEIATIKTRTEQREAEFQRQAEQQKALFEAQLAMDQEKHQAEISNQRAAIEGKIAATQQEHERRLREADQNHIEAMAKLKADFELNYQAQHDSLINAQRKDWIAREQNLASRTNQLSRDGWQLAANIRAARERSAQIEGHTKVLEAGIARLESEIEGYMRTIARTDPANASLLATVNRLMDGLQSQLPLKRQELTHLREESGFIRQELAELAERSRENDRCLAETQAMWKLCHDYLSKPGRASSPAADGPLPGTRPESGFDVRPMNDEVDFPEAA